MGGVLFRDAFVHSLVSTTDQNDSLQRRELSGGLLIKRLSGGRKQYDRGAVTLWRLLGEQRFHRFKERLWLQYHPFAAAKGPVIDGAMPVAREIAQIVYMRFNEL